MNPRVVRYRDEDQVTKIAVSQTIIQHVIAKKEGVLSSNAMTDQRFMKGKSVHNLVDSIGDLRADQGAGADSGRD